MTNSSPKFTSAFAAAAVVASAWASEARAQQWSALDRQPRPNNIVAVDSSMTMALDPGGNWAEFGNNRLRRAQTLLTGFPGSEENGAMYLFRDQFAWGGYSFSSSIEAHIKDGRGNLPHLPAIPDTRVRPRWDDRPTSYAQTRNMINGLRVDYCLTTGKNAYNCLEQRLPGGGSGPACITPGCAYDQPLLEHLTQNPMTGLSLPMLPNPPDWTSTSTIYPAGWPRFTFPCDKRNPAGYPDSPTTTPLPPGCPRTSPSQPYDPSCPVVNIPYEIAHELGGAYYQWPRFSDLDGDGDIDVDASVVAQDICNPLRNAYQKIQAKLNECRNTPPTLSPPFQCVPGQLANTLCEAPSPFMGGTITPINGSPISLPTTCVCNANGAGCISGGGSDACGNPLYFPARQQVAICHSHDTGGGNEPASSAREPADDNVLRDPNVHTPSANPDQFCRSSAVTFVTDAVGSHPLGVASTSPRNSRFYFADFSTPQNNVVTMGGAGQLLTGTAIQSVIRGVAPPGVPTMDGESGGALNLLRARFSRDLNRSLKGVYAAAAPALSQYQDRAAFMVMEVPGSASNQHLDYFGRPVRLEWWEMNPTTGQPVRMLFSTDEDARVGLSPVNGPFNTVDAFRGPNGSWRGTTVTKDLLIPANILDRNGDGTPDTHPPVRWGYHLGGEGSRPVIVGAPLDMPEGSQRAAFAQWKQQPAVFRRDRVAYALSNGYLHAYRVGRVASVRNYTSGPALTPLGNVDVGLTYDDNPANTSMGREIFRYRPQFVTRAGNASSASIGGQPRYTYNDVLQQPLIERGQLFVRDVQLTKGASPRFATVLVMSQGAAGRGFAALDVSDPNAPQVLWDDVRLANGALALAAPTIYMWPDPLGGDPIPVLLAVGGALTPPPAGSPRVDSIYAYRLVDGALIHSQPLLLDGGRQRAWPNTPVCVDRDGAGRMDRCFVLASDGTVAELRISPTAGTFSAPFDATPAGIRGRGLVFNSGLTAYFAGNNRVALVFGSGDISEIERGDGQTNSVFKIIAEGRGGTAGNTRLADSCRPAGALVDGEFRLRPGEMVVSPPTVAKGAVAFTSYVPGRTGCMDGQSQLYAFDFETCRDVLVPPGVAPPTRKPLTGRLVGAGLPSSPVLLRQSGKLLAYASSTPSGAGAVSTDVRTRGGAFETVKPLFFRIRSSSR